MLFKRNGIPHIYGTLFRLCKRYFDVSTGPSGDSDAQAKGEAKVRAPRADAQRNLDALLTAAKDVFACVGCDAPVRQIAERAGVGVGTVYRHFPQRSDLIIGVFRRELDACADAAVELQRDHPPGEAVALWMQRFVDFMSTKRGLGAALYSGDPAYASLPCFFESQLVPALQSLLDAAVAAGEMRADIQSADLITAAANMSKSDLDQARRMVGLLVDGLRHGAGRAPSA